MAAEFLLLAAMDQEREPFLAASEQVGAEIPGPTRVSRLTPLVLGGRRGQVLVTGIGPVNAAAALSGWLAQNEAAGPVVSVGTAGGLHPQVSVGEVVIGTEYRYADVDARAFGYAFGQVPGMPAQYPASSAAAVAGRRWPEFVHTGLLVTSSSFVSAELAGQIRTATPGALAVDMESAALAQTCYLHRVSTFISVRGISDLCTPRAGEDFHDGLGQAAQRSAEVSLTLLAGELPR